VIHFLQLFAHGVGLAIIAVIPPRPPGTGVPGATGPGPQGLTNSPGVQAKPGFLATTINQSFYVILAVTGVPQQCPPMYVPPGAQVSIRAHNGTDAGNQHIVRLAHQPELLGSTQGNPITPDSDISWPCNSTGEIWVVGNLGDGINVSIQAQRV
jgi:hypothetical protein